MAVDIQHSSSRKRGKKPPLSNINVTPFVDVMLVLLIVFMITAPLLTVGVSVDLPETKAPSITEDKEPLVISVDKDGIIYLQETALAKASELLPRLQAITSENQDVPIFIRGDEALQYGLILKIMADLSNAGFNEVSLLAKLP